MNKNILLLLSLLFFGNITIATAHALFIKTETSGVKDKIHEVSVFYAEPAEGKKEQLNDWWSDTKEFSLWLISPDGSTKKLEVTSKNDHFAAAFTPLSDGAYKLAIHHDVAQTFDSTQYQFNASATVFVGTETVKKTAETTEGLFLAISTTKININNALPITILDKGEPTPDLPVTFFAPNGWSKTLITDANGNVEFTPLWEGEYLVETYKVDEVANEADFNKKHRIVTSVLTVNN